MEEEKNYIKVENTTFENTTIFVRYHEFEPEEVADSYPYSIYFYQDGFVYNYVDGLIENAFVNIRVDLNTSKNGILDEGLYIGDEGSLDEMTCQAAWQSTKLIGQQTIDDNKLVDNYERLPLKNIKLHVRKSDEYNYIITLEATDIDGQEILAYYNGGTNYKIYFEDI